MTTIPRLQEFLCGLNLKTGSYIILSASLAITFFGLVIVTAVRVEEKTTESDLDFQYIINMVASIIMFLTTPMALYGTYRERCSFLIPYLAVEGFGIVILGGNLVIETIKLVGEESGSFSVVVFMLIALGTFNDLLQNTYPQFSLTFEIFLVMFYFFVTLIATFTYSFLVIFSYYTTLKQQREEIQ